MKLNKVESFLYFFLSVGVFWLAFPTMLSVFTVPNPNYVIIPIVLLSLTAHYVRLYVLKIPLYVSVIIGSLYLSNWIISQTPFFTFAIREYRVLKELIIARSGEYTVTTSYLIILLFLLILVEFQFYWRKVLIVGIICIGYLMLLNVFNDISVVKNVIMIACLSLALQFLLSNGLRQPQLFFIVTILICFIGLGTLFIPTKKAQTKILSNMTSYRSYVTEKGLYRFIAERGSGEFKRTGFGEDDSRLGGSISDDFTIQFEAKQKNPHYWKVDSKSVYTGKGWEKASQEEQVDEAYEESIQFERNFVNKEFREDVTLSLFYTDNYVPVTYGQLEIRDVNNRLVFSKNETTDRVTVNESNRKAEILIGIEPLAYEEADLRGTSDSLPINQVDYLQLPNDFPEEIRELALEITKDETSKIDKVLAVQTYLKTNEKFRYSKEETTYPDESQDYVEHFLFDTLIGYCDNFSTAMAVMLRSIDIPTRWAKGFNTGSPASKEDGLDIYIIRNSNAHSWVEVYFDNYGWLPFEPTPSFTQPMVQLANNTSESTTTESTSTQSSSTTNQSSSSLENSSSNQGTTDTNNNKQTETVNFEKLKPYVISFGIVSLIIIAGIVYKYWLHLFVLLALRHETFNFTYFYPLILKKAERTLERDSNEPLLNFANRLEIKYPQYKTDFSYLTKIYEEYIYGGINSFSERDKVKVRRISYLLHFKFKNKEK